MKIDILDLQHIVKAQKRLIIKKARFVLNKMGEQDIELSILLVDDPGIKKLNKQYLHKNSPTDVMAFSMRDGLGINDSRILGDVVISTETAKRESRKRGRSVSREIELYLVHGILHLLGFRDNSKKEKLLMRKKESELMGDR